MSFRRWPEPPGGPTGHDPRSAYVERFWLGVLGPSATWIIRRLADEFDANPEGFDVDRSTFARSIGLSDAKGTESPFGRSLQRCIMFGLVRESPHGFETRRRVPDVPPRQLARMNVEMRTAHEEWMHRTWTTDVTRIAEQLCAAGFDQRSATTAADVLVSVSS